MFGVLRNRNSFESSSHYIEGLNFKASAYKTMEEIINYLFIKTDNNQ